MSYSYNFDFDFESFEDLFRFVDTNLPIQEFARIFSIVMIAVVSFGLAVSIACYIMQAVAIRRIALRRQIKAAWLAWIPLARNWTMGAIIDENDRRTIGRDRRFRIFALIINSLYSIVILFFIAAVIGIITSLLSMETWDWEYALSILSAGFGAFSGTAGYFTYLYMLMICMQYLLIFKLYDSINPGLALIFTFLSVIVPYFMPISLLCMRHKGYPFPEEEPAISEAERIGWYNQD